MAELDEYLDATDIASTILEDPVGYEEEEDRDISTTLDNVEEGEDDFDDVELEDKPGRESEEWSDWVLSQLHKDELPKGNPTCDGLRRIAIQEFGEFDVHPTIVHVVNETYAAVTVTLAFSHRVVSASAEVSEYNMDTDDMYIKYPLATAETRAISRALKQVLNLRKVVTAEETSRKAKISVAITEQDDDKVPITETQLKLIDIRCRDRNISAHKVLEFAKIEDYNNIKELTKAQALEVVKYLDKLGEDISDELGDYDHDWQNKE